VRAVISRAGLGLALAAAAALRFIGLGSQSFWFDESATAAIVAKPLSGVWHSIVHEEITPPLYYTAAWLWTHVTGISEAGLRSLSALCGVLLVGLVYAAARELAGRTAGLVAAVVAAVNPMLVWYSQEARSYGLVTVFAALSVLALVRCLNRPTRGWLVLWSVACALMLATHYFSCFLVLPQAVLLLVRAQERRPVLLASLIWVATAIALIPLAHYQASDGQASWVNAIPSGHRLDVLVQELASANTRMITESTLAPGGGWWLLAAAAIAVTVILALVRRRSAAPNLGGLALVAVVSLVVPLALAATSLDYFLDRNLIATWPLLAVLLAAAVARAAPLAVSAAVAAAIAVAGLGVNVAVATDDTLQRADWRSAIERIGPTDTPRGIVLQPSYAGTELSAYGVRVAAAQPGVGVRELVVLGTSTSAASAPAALGPFKVVERRDHGAVGFVRYRAPGLTRLTATQLAQSGGLRFQATAAARAWFARFTALATGWLRTGPGDGAVAAARALLPVPAELPDPAGLGRRLLAAAAAVERSGAGTPEARAAVAGLTLRP
jgi:mannosyltransferase